MALTAVTTTDRTWTKVLSSVTTGVVWLMSETPFVYMVTFVAAGAAAPTDELTARELPWPGAAVSNSSSIDVYIKSKSTSTDDGNIMVVGS